MGDPLATMQRRLGLDPEDFESRLRWLLELKRRSEPILDAAVDAVLAGAPVSRRGVRRSWFRKLWARVPYRVNRRDVPKVELGPFAARRAADLRSAELRTRDLRAAALPAAQLVGADLWCADLSGADLRHADLDGANLIRARLVGARLNRANLTRVDLIHADLAGADLKGAILDRANLRGANLFGVDFRGASLVGTKIEGWPRADVLVDSSTIGPDGLRPGEREALTA